MLIIALRVRGPHHCSPPVVGNPRIFGFWLAGEIQVAEGFLPGDLQRKLQQPLRGQCRLPEATAASEEGKGQSRPAELSPELL